MFHQIFFKLNTWTFLVIQFVTQLYPQTSVKGHVFTHHPKKVTAWITRTWFFPRKLLFGKPLGESNGEMKNQILRTLGYVLRLFFSEIARKKTNKQTKMQKFGDGNLGGGFFKHTCLFSSLFLLRENHQKFDHLRHIFSDGLGEKPLKLLEWISVSVKKVRFLIHPGTMRQVIHSGLRKSRTMGWKSPSFTTMWVRIFFWEPFSIRIQQAKQIQGRKFWKSWCAQEMDTRNDGAFSNKKRMLPNLREIHISEV